jgi:hypothetical protein
MRGIIPTVAALFLCSCAKPVTNSEHSATIPGPVVAARQVADRCGLTGQVDFTSTGERELTVSRLDPNADYGKVDCLLVGLRSLHLNLGLVGNEAYGPGTANAQAN